jgi:hypothetical protein
MNKKIVQFLKDAGYEANNSEPAALQLLRYFEEEYGVALLALIEREWIDEQLHRDLSGRDFAEVREFIDDQYLDKFDRTLARIEAYE